MASVRNAFELLVANGSGDQPAAAAKGKKKGKKKKGSEPAEAPAAAPAKPAARPVVVAEDDTDFRPVTKVVKARTAAPEARPAAEKASDAGAALEREAVAATGGSRAALAAKWAEQVRTAAAGPKYTDGGKQLDFKQVLVKSRALELLVEGYLSGCTASDAAPLAALLAVAAHPAAPAGLPGALAAAVVGLGELAALDPLSGAAQARQSAGAAVALLKSGVAAPAERGGRGGAASQLGGLAAKLEALEAQLPKTTSLKEQVRLWGDIFSTTQQKLDVVRGAGSARAPPEVAAALGPLDGLHGALEGRMKEVQRAKEGATIESQLARADATYKQEEAAMQARLTEVEVRVKQLEEEMAELRQEAAQIKERRAWAQQHQQQLVQKIKSGATDSAAVEEGLQAGLRAVDHLRSSLQAAAASVGPAEDAGTLAAQVVEKEVPGKFVGAVQQVIELGLRLLHEMGGKAQFYRDRLAQAVRQAEHLALLKLTDNKQQEEHRKQTDNLKKMLQDVLAAAEAATQAVRDAAAAYRQRLGLMLTLPNFLPPPPEFSAHLEAMAGQAQQMLQSIINPPAEQPAPRAASRAESPEKARAPSPTKQKGRGASPQKSRGNGASAAPASVVAAAPGPAPAPAPQATELVALEQRLAALEEQNRQKDAQIAALLAQATVEVPSPLPAMLGSPPPTSLGLPPLVHTLSGPPSPFPPTSEPTSLFSQPPAPAVPATAAAPLDLLGSAQAAPAADMLSPTADPQAAAPPRAAPTSFAQALAAGRGAKR